MTNLQVDPENELFQRCVYMIKCTNKFFRLIRSEGIFMEADSSAIARTVGHEMNVPYN